MAVAADNMRLNPSLPAARRWSSLARCRVVIVSLSVVLAVIGAGIYLSDRSRAVLPLHAGTVALGAGGVAVAVPDDPGLLVPGTRVLRSAPDAPQLAAAQRRWLASGTVPEVAELGESTLVRDALLDLLVLSSDHGVAVAGWSDPWRYVWPRDAALVATALAGTGHLADAERIIAFLQQVQPESGLFEGRYLPDGSGVPDDRGVQLDGLGWSLWALWQVAQQQPAEDRAEFVRRHRPLLDRSTAAILQTIEPTTGLPPASPDYWEVAESRLTLATAALLRSGLESAAALHRTLGRSASAESADRAAARMAEAINATFAADGFPRYAGGGAGSVDLGVCFMLPPFTKDSVGRDRAAAVWREAKTPMRRAAGGLAPGGSWPDDGISWNTATSTYAMTAAFLGSREETLSWLRWLDQHRTRQGSIPEKVLHNGDPASVAPLAWAAAATIIAAAELG